MAVSMPRKIVLVVQLLCMLAIVGGILGVCGALPNRIIRGMSLSPTRFEYEFNMGALIGLLAFPVGYRLIRQKKIVKSGFVIWLTALPVIVLFGIYIGLISPIDQKWDLLMYVGATCLHFAVVVCGIFVANKMLTNKIVDHVPFVVEG